jgi:hypothetical protein
LQGGFAARQCVVQDMSATGAKVTIDDPNALPAKLTLAFRATPAPGETAKWSGAAASPSASSSSVKIASGPQSGFSVPRRPAAGAGGPEIAFPRGLFSVRVDGT